MIYLVSDLSTKFFTTYSYVNMVVASVDTEEVIKAMGFTDQPIICAINDPEAVKLINEELGSNFVPSNAEAKLDEDQENSGIIAQITDGKIQWFTVWIE